MRLVCPSILKHALNFLYPPVCLCCKAILEPQFKTLCQSCFEDLQLLSPASRCRRCFHPLDERGHRCFTSPMKSLAACFEESPSSQALLALPGKAIAPFIALQLETLRWPIPDYVIPSPGDWFSQGNDRWAIRKEIAEAVAHLFNTTYSPCLTLNRYLLPIVYRSLESQKTTSSREVVSLHSPSLIVNARILLIHDTFISGNALSTAAKALMHHGALGVWGISLISG